MVFRRTMPQEDLRESMTAEQVARHETTYQASRGGHFPAEDKQLPGAPLEGERSS